MWRLSNELICASETTNLRKQKWNIEKYNFVESDCRNIRGELSRTRLIYAASGKLTILMKPKILYT